MTAVISQCMQETEALALCLWPGREGGLARKSSPKLPCIRSNNKSIIASSSPSLSPRPTPCSSSTTLHTSRLTASLSLAHRSEARLHDGFTRRQSSFCTNRSSSFAHVGLLLQRSPPRPPVQTRLAHHLSKEDSPAERGSSRQALCRRTPRTRADYRCVSRLVSAGQIVANLAALQITSRFPTLETGVSQHQLAFDTQEGQLQ